MNAGLAYQQQSFARALLELEQQEAVAGLFKPVPDLTQRLTMYRGNLTAICINTLMQAYPILLQLVGQDYFEQMAKAYARSFPAQTGNLAEFGQDLAHLLQDRAEISTYPYLPDIARLEWLLHRTYYAKERTVLDLPALARQAQVYGADPMTLSLGWQDYAELVSSDFAVASIWQSLQNQDDLSACKWQQAEFVLIYRDNWQSQLQILSQADYAALHVLRQGQPIGTALEAALNLDAGFDIGGQLQAWFAAGLFYLN